MNRQSSDRPHVVIVGCGFGGLAATRALADVDVDVTVVDRENHHTFQPLLYQVATAGLNPSDIAQPIRHVIRKQDNARVLLDEVFDVDLDARTVRVTDGDIGYDYLIVATGATHSYFGNDDWAEFAPGLKTIDDALDVRRRILLAFERAEATTDPDERARQMTFVVVGAGPTGVELAGAVKEIATTTLRADFRTIDTTASRVVLLEAGPRVLPAFPDSLSASAEKQLTDVGVDVRTSTAVTGIDADGVATADGPIPSATVLWGAGVAASPLGRAVAADLDRAGRVPVTAELAVGGHPEVFVIGDLAASESGGVAVPGVAPAAIQGGEHAARCIEADLSGSARPTFVYEDKGSLATIGRSKAVADLSPRLRFGGLLAWLVWCFVHVWSLIGFRSKLRTMSTWVWQYLTGRRGARLITGTTHRRHPPSGSA
ncbi:NAD(P)/FAD-dependent oxidoreductase [Ilumatobacter nonamiensis]|uniref:NAD(P)/FAD-dependent oxidoreductase n=1 Tax=Ilumatobacter nonamiensis TaxID=467093 RepID=UPI00034872D6|nr:NAD(P)/FAD-dependent oxidoreductase [Ilumatobacter nonamiensis]